MTAGEFASSEKAAKATNEKTADTAEALKGAQVALQRLEDASGLLVDKLAITLTPAIDGLAGFIDSVVKKGAGVAVADALTSNDPGAVAGTMAGVGGLVGIGLRVIGMGGAASAASVGGLGLGAGWLIGSQVDKYAGGWIGERLEEVIGRGSVTPTKDSGALRALLDKIAKGESRGNYGAYNAGAFAGQKVLHSGVDENLTNMTIRELIESGKTKKPDDPTRRKFSGKYQMGDAFLQDAVAKGFVGMDDKFTPENQERIAAEVVSGILRKFKTEEGAKNEIARVWMAVKNSKGEGSAPSWARAANKATTDISPELNALMSGVGTQTSRLSQVRMRPNTSQATSKVDVSIGTINLESSNANPAEVAMEIPMAMKSHPLITGINSAGG
jgi:hypothetical protein